MPKTLGRPAGRVLGGTKEPVLALRPPFGFAMDAWDQEDGLQRCPGLGQPAAGLRGGHAAVTVPPWLAGMGWLAWTLSHLAAGELPALLGDRTTPASATSDDPVRRETSFREREGWSSGAEASLGNPDNVTAPWSCHLGGKSGKPWSGWQRGRGDPWLESRGGVHLYPASLGSSERQVWQEGPHCPPPQGLQSRLLPWSCTHLQLSAWP